MAMNPDRRSFLGLSAGASALALASSTEACAADVTADVDFDAALDAELEAAASKPVLDVAPFTNPVIIDAVELLHGRDDYFCRVRSRDGAVGVSADNGRAEILAPIFTRLVAPFFIGKDARQLEDLHWALYREGDNYKYQGLALWCCVAMVEFAILDLLGQIAKKPMAELLGGVVRQRVPFYVASGRRDTTPDQEIEYLQSLIAQTGAKAVKYRVGGRMSKNADAMPGRTET